MAGLISDPESMIPYVGPRPFRTTEADRFYGRAQEARDVCSLWRSERVVVLHGPAAAGKTSLLHAGVLPLLVDEEETELLPVGRLTYPTLPLADPPTYLRVLLESWGAPGHGETVLDFLEARTRQERLPRSLLAAIDHVEGLFTTFPPHEADWRELIDALAAALAGVEALKLLLVVRDDHLALLESFESRLSREPFARIRLEALSADSAEEAVTGPLEGTSKRYAPQVALSLVESLRVVTFTDLVGNKVTVTRDLIEPLHLQIACLGLWSSLPEGTSVITGAHLEAFGGQALKSFYNEAMADVAAVHHLAEQALRDWLELAFATELGTRGSAHRGPTATAGMPNDVADALVERHVLTTELRLGLTWYQLGQDQLVSAVREANLEWRNEHGHRAQTLAGQEPYENFRAAAEAALRSGDLRAAQEYAANAAAGYGEAGNGRGRAHALELQGDIARASGDLDGAERTFRDARSQFADLLDDLAGARLLSAIADLRFQAGRYAEAADLQREAISTLPGDAEAMTGLGYAQWYGGSPADAVATFNQVLGQDRNVPAALVGRGQALADISRYGDALVDLRRALDLGHPDEADVRSALALALAGLGRTADADAELATARRLATGWARTHLRAGRIAMLRRQTALARAELLAAMDAEPPLPPAHQDTVRILLDRLPS